MLEAWKKGDKIQVTRKKIGGGTEKVVAEFQSVVSNGRQLWCLINGKRVRVSISGASLAPNFDKGGTTAAKPAKPETVKAPIKEKKTAKPDLLAMAAEAAEEAAAPKGKPVKTEAKPKAKKETKKPIKKVIGEKGAVKQPNKTERVVVALAKGEIATDKIHEDIGCDTSLVSDWAAVIKACETGGAHFDDKVIMKRVGRPAHLVAKYYNIYLNAKK